MCRHLYQGSLVVRCSFQYLETNCCFLHSSSEPQAVGDESVEQTTNSNTTEGTTPAGKNPTETSPTNPKETDNGNDTTSTSKTAKPSEVTISAADLQLSMARAPGTAQPAVKTS